MKEILKLIIATLILSSCNSNSEEQNEIQTINPYEIKQSEIVHNELTTEQINKIKKIHSTFQEVDNISLEQTITDFKRDLNPDNEIKVWLNMADAYENFLNSIDGKMDLNTKNEVYGLILSRSMMPNEEAIKNSNLKILSKNEAEKVLSFYKEEPDPIDVIQK